jgi:CelD/BcsL family acetyltransferase involved in cellulose biosynthesis
VNGALAAVAQVLVARRRAHLYQLAFDPGLARRSPGALLCGHAIEAAAAEGCLAFDFLRGDEPYKYAFGATGRPTWRRRLGGRELAALAAAGRRGAVRVRRRSRAVTRDAGPVHSGSRAPGDTDDLAGDGDASAMRAIGARNVRPQ